jgi:hypothetical protein
MSARQDVWERWIISGGQMPDITQSWPLVKEVEL